MKMSPRSLMTMNSKFGWLLSGPAPSHAPYCYESSPACNIMETKTTRDKEQNKLLPRFWEIDVIGIQENNNSNNITMNNFNQTVNRAWLETQLPL